MFLESLLQSFSIAKAGCGYHIDKGKDFPVFSILDAMKMLDLAWPGKSENLHYP